MKGVADALRELHLLLTWDPARGVGLSEMGGFRWLGRPEQAVMPLRDFLYVRFFCRWTADGRRSRYADRSSGEPSFVAALSAAARGATYWERGWHLVKSDGPWAFVSNGRICLFVDDRRCLKPESARPGTAVHLKLPCARENLAPGFFSLVSRAGPVEDGAPRLEIYVNLAPDAAPAFVEALLSKRMAESLRFTARLVNDPAAYGRVDTALLHVDPQSYAGLMQLLLDWHRSHAQAVRAGTPLFTKEIVPGVAVAESPRSIGPEPESFGEHRCRLFAQGLVEALAKEAPREEWVQYVERQFRREGLSLERPYVKELKAARTRSGISFGQRAPRGQE